MFKWFWTIFSLGAPEETADISRRHNWFPREMTSEERAEKFHDDDVTIWVDWKLKRSVSDLQCQFSPTGQCPIQPLLEPFEHNFGQNSSIKRVLQPTLGPISALGSDCILLTERAPFLGLKQTFWFTVYYLGSASDWMKQIFNQSEALYNQ